jgi:hypothetical protein
MRTVSTAVAAFDDVFGTGSPYMGSLVWILRCFGWADRMPSALAFASDTPCRIQQVTLEHALHRARHRRDELGRR